MRSGFRHTFEPRNSAEYQAEPVLGLRLQRDSHSGGGWSFLSVFPVTAKSGICGGGDGVVLGFGGGKRSQAAKFSSVGV